MKYFTIIFSVIMVNVVAEDRFPSHCRVWFMGCDSCSRTESGNWECTDTQCVLTAEEFCTETMDGQVFSNLHEYHQYLLSRKRTTNNGNRSLNNEIIMSQVGLSVVIISVFSLILLV